MESKKTVAFRSIGILGGTFDPIHIGHVLLARTARDLLKLDLVLMVVANDPYQKTQVKAVSNAWARYRIAKATLEKEDKIRPSLIEIERSGKSYMIDTVERVKNDFNPDEIFLIVGSDLIESLDTWKNIEELGKIVTLAIFERSVYENVPTNKYFEKQLYFSRDHFQELPNISSSEVKNIILKNGDMSQYLIKETIRAIEIEKLYDKNNEDFTN
jgi:nicotinate-nucleotide adenylyltransferase